MISGYLRGLQKYFILYGVTRAALLQPGFRRNAILVNLQGKYIRALANPYQD